MPFSAEPRAPRRVCDDVCGSGGSYVRVATYRCVRCSLWQTPQPSMEKSPLFFSLGAVPDFFGEKLRPKNVYPILRVILGAVLSLLQGAAAHKKSSSIVNVFRNEARVWFLLFLFWQKH